MRIYLDSCSLSRPWDDQSQIRIHREAESVLFLIEEARVGKLEVVSSDYLLQELSETVDEERRQKMLGMVDVASLHIPAAESVLQRASALESHNIKGYDALHLAAAEAAGASFLVTTDDRLLNRAQRAGSVLKVQVINPADWPPHSSPS